MKVRPAGSHHRLKRLQPWGGLVVEGIMATLLLLTVGGERLTVDAASQLIFAFIPKSLSNPFYDPAFEGCQDKAKELNDTTCWILGPNVTDDLDESDESGALQAQIVSDLLAEHAKNASTLQGLAVSVQNEELMTPLLNQAAAAGLAVVTFDSDAPNSQRKAYIGTDNYFFGQQLAKMVKKLVPRGGTYATLQTSAPNILQRVAGLVQELESVSDPIKRTSSWRQLPGSPADVSANVSAAIDILQAWADQEEHPDVLIPTFGAILLTPRWEEMVRKHKNVTFVAGDDLPQQLDLLERGLVHGLVGQLPYLMGYKSIAVLHELVTTGETQSVLPGTDVLTHVLVPLHLPDLTVDNNLIGPLSIVGFTLFGIVAVLSVGFGTWTFAMRKRRVVQLAQPLFLILVAAGVLVMGSALIPLSLDDHGQPSLLDERRSALICMSIPWLASCGFTLTFAALFSKTHRVHRLFQATATFRRAQVTAKDVMVPLLVLLSANIVILTIWTILDPLKYVRKAYPGLDEWNRTLATYGACRSSDSATPYLILLSVVNVTALIMALWQAYVSRKIELEFSESKYITFAILSLFQAFITGIPLIFVVRSNAQAYYLVMVFMIFIICMTVLLLIFIPKIYLAGRYLQHSSSEQNLMIGKRMKQTQENLAGKDSSNKREGSEGYYRQEREQAGERMSQSLPVSLSSQQDRLSSRGESEVQSALSTPPDAVSTADRSVGPEEFSSPGESEVQSALSTRPDTVSTADSSVGPEEFSSPGESEGQSALSLPPDAVSTADLSVVPEEIPSPGESEGQSALSTHPDAVSTADLSVVPEEIPSPGESEGQAALSSPPDAVVSTADRSVGPEEIPSPGESEGQSALSSPPDAVSTADRTVGP